MGVEWPSTNPPRELQEGAELPRPPREVVARLRDAVRSAPAITWPSHSLTIRMSLIRTNLRRTQRALRLRSWRWLPCLVTWPLAQGAPEQLWRARVAGPGASRRYQSARNRGFSSR